MTPPRKFVLCVISISLVVASGACSSGTKKSGTSPTSGSAASGDPLKIGMVCTCSGQQDTDNVPMEDVYKSWVNTVNQSGGLDGHPIDLIVQDDAGIPGKSLTAAQALISNHVDAIVDNTTLDSTWAAAVQAAQIPVVGMNLPDETFYTNPDFYPDGQTNDSAVYAVVATAKAAGASNLGVIYCAEAPVCETLVPLVTTAGKSLGVPVVYSASIAATAPNYTAQCVAAQQRHVSALAVFDVSAPNIRLGANCGQQNYNPIYVTEGFGYTSDQGQASGLGKNLWGEYSTLPYWSNSPQIKKMNEAVDKYYPGIRKSISSWSQGVSSSWASGILLADAVNAGGLTKSTQPTASEIIDGLKSLHGDDLDGLSPAPLSFAQGKNHPVDCWFTAQIKNGVPTLANGGRPTCETGTSS